MKWSAVRCEKRRGAEARRPRLPGVGAARRDARARGQGRHAACRARGSRPAPWWRAPRRWPSPGPRPARRPAGRPRGARRARARRRAAAGQVRIIGCRGRPEGQGQTARSSGAQSATRSARPRPSAFPARVLAGRGVGSTRAERVETTFDGLESSSGSSTTGKRLSIRVTSSRRATMPSPRTTQPDACAPSRGGAQQQHAHAGRVEERELAQVLGDHQARSRPSPYRAEPSPAPRSRCRDRPASPTIAASERRVDSAENAHRASPRTTPRSPPRRARRPISPRADRPARAPSRPRGPDST